MTKLPPAKNENIVVQNVDNEILIYNLESNKAFCLNETSAIIYQACDGKTELHDLKKLTNYSDDLIFFALDELHNAKLIENNYISPHKGIKRRELIKKIGFASFVALPVISMMVAPTSAMAQSACLGNAAPGTPISCTMGVAGCEVNVAQQNCASCMAVATTPSPFCSGNPNFPYLCTCA